MSSIGNSRGVHVRGRFWYTLSLLGTTVLLVGWGGFVTSIDAGLAVPDWPTSFNSYDPFNPWPEWWTLTPVLAEHGHRLLGALVGLLTIGLAGWTWFADARRWMKWLGLVALVLVSLQGALGGLRVVWVSLDLAVVHACVAQLYFALIACMMLFTSRSWQRAADSAALDETRLAQVSRLSLATGIVVYVQIILGALLRHPGTGIDASLATLHILGATAVLVLVFTLFARGRALLRPTPAGPWISALAVIVLLQIALGLTAYLVLLDERGVLMPSNLQVIINTSHLVLGAVLFSSTIVSTVILTRMRLASLKVAPIESPKSINPDARRRAFSS